MILPFTIGREKEIGACLLAIQEGKNLILTGATGVGKSHLLVEIMRRLKSSSASIYHVKSPNPPMYVVDEIYKWLSSQAGIARPRRIDSTVHLPDFVKFIADVLTLPVLSDKTLVLLVDGFDQLTTPAVPVWEVLAEKCAIIAVGHKRQDPRCARLLHMFDLLEIGPMSRADSRDMVEKIIERSNDISIADPRTKEFLLRHIATLSNGSPRAIAESVHRLRGAARIDENYVRNIPPHRSGVSLGDATPILLVVGLTFMIARLIARGMYMLDAWAIFGTFAAIFGYLGLHMRRTRREIT